MNDRPDAIPVWARAHGEPVCAATIRTVPEDFFVDECLGFEPDGDSDGEHDLLLIEKTGANTAWVARALARHAGVPPGDVGYAGMKDRHAVTRQSFSVRRPNRDGTDWSVLEVEGVKVLSIGRHSRKIRRGTHQSNRFVIRLRGAAITENRDALLERITTVAELGVPNYFGEQRFGRDGSNIELARAVLGGKRIKRDKRSIGISAARSLLFNKILNARVSAGNWNSVLPGDLANLDGSRSVFAVDAVDDELSARCAVQDIHPTASLWGDGAPNGQGDVAELERAAVADDVDLVQGLEKARIEVSHRPLRLLTGDLRAEFQEGSLLLEFQLVKGGFATTVLREICAVSPGSWLARASQGLPPA